MQETARFACPLEHLVRAHRTPDRHESSSAHAAYPVRRERPSSCKSVRTDGGRPGISERRDREDVRLSRERARGRSRHMRLPSILPPPAPPPPPPAAEVPRTSYRRGRSPVVEVATARSRHEGNGSDCRTADPAGRTIVVRLLDPRAFSSPLMGRNYLTATRSGPLCLLV